MHTTRIKTDRGFEIVLIANGDWSGDIHVRLFPAPKHRVERDEGVLEEWVIPGWILLAVCKRISDDRLGSAVIDLIEQWKG